MLMHYQVLPSETKFIYVFFFSPSYNRYIAFYLHVSISHVQICLHIHAKIQKYEVDNPIITNLEYP